jgi:hypothetical protein
MATQHILVPAALLALCGQIVSAAPVLTCTEPVWDFGRIRNTETIRHTFTLANTGDGTLEIDRLRVCCGATAELSTNRVPPGGAAALSVDLRLLGRTGRQHKSIYVVSNDPASPFFRIELVGVAFSDIDVNPDRVDFGAVSEGDRREQTVLLTVQAGSGLRVTNVWIDDGPYEASFAPVTEGEQYAVTVRTAPPLPAGFARGRVVVLTDSRVYPRVEISIAARVDADVVIVPHAIVMRPSADRGAITRYVAVRSRSGTPFRILEVLAPTEEVTVKQFPMGKHGYRFALTAREIDGLDGRFLGIRTDLEGAEEIDIPIRVEEMP